MNCPECNSSNTHKNGKDRSGVQKYTCKDCNKYFDENTPSKHNGSSAAPAQKRSTPSSGISISQFRKVNDVSARVQEVFDKLSPSKLYSLEEIQEATGFRRGFPELRKTIDSHKEHYGKGVADGVIYFGHPDTIAELKREKTMS